VTNFSNAIFFTQPIREILHELKDFRNVVYLLRNTINAKCYVGKTNRTLYLRMKEHLGDKSCNVSQHLANAFLYYGENAFRIEILAFAESKDELITLEKLWIAALRSYDPNVGFDQNDGHMEGEKLVHSGQCTYCVVCNPGIRIARN